jgi:hypothetical protein
VIRDKYFSTSKYYSEPYSFYKEGFTNIDSSESYVLGNPNYGLSNHLFKIREAVEKPEIIISFRNQVDLIKSSYKYDLIRHREYLKFDDWLKTSGGGKYIAILDYDIIYNTIKSILPESKVHFIFMEEMKVNPDSYYDQIYTDILKVAKPNHIKFSKVSKNSYPYTKKTLQVRRSLNRFKYFSCFDKRKIAIIEDSLHLGLAQLIGRFGGDISDDDFFKSQLFEKSLKDHWVKGNLKLLSRKPELESIFLKYRYIY